MHVGRRWQVALWLFAVIALVATPAAAKALKVGEHYPVRISSHGSSDVEGAPTARGRLFTVTHPGATYMAIHFEEFDLAPGSALRISDADGGQSYVLRGRGKMEARNFWSQHVKGDTIVLDLVTRGPQDGGFLIDEYAAGIVGLGSTEAVCGTNDSQNAVCFSGSNPDEYGKAQAVARLLIQGSSLCTGWLASSSNHLITNEHCISSSAAALNTDYEFGSEAPTCGSSNCQLCWTGTVFSGATFIQDSPSLDYALVQITSGDPAATYGFLAIDDRTAIDGEQIYIPQHPAGRAREMGINSSHDQDGGGVCQVNSTSEASCSGTAPEVGYYCDTEGGSSGSPVLATSTHKVIALHHCRGSLTCNQTGNDPNRGVPIDLICDEICGLLGPECTVGSDCDDGDACTLDECNSGSCKNTPQANCCGNGTCESGEDCNSCAPDCVSGSSSGAVCGNGVCETADGEDCVSCAADCNGVQKGKPSNRFCCGDGGTNPVGCGSAACTSGGYQCTTTPAGGGGAYCCGDSTCDSGEDCGNCGLDCSSGAEVCDDGFDNDCNGDVDCADAACAGAAACQGCQLGARGDACDTGADCCSGACKRNGTCR